MNRDHLGRFARCDICAVDLDECLFPGFSQSRLGQTVALRSCLNPRHWRLLPALVRAGGFITRVRWRERTGWRASNELLLGMFDRYMAGLPLPLVVSSARWLPHLAFPGWRDALSLVAQRMPVCLLSYAMSPVVDAFARCVDRRGRPIFSRTYGNPIQVVGRGEHARIERTWLPATRCRPDEKLDVLKGWMREMGARYPLVIGHSPYEAPMAELARKVGGLSIGTNPLPSVADAFDIVLRQWTWRPLRHLLRRLTIESRAQVRRQRDVAAS